jgi:hypothetical protein
MRWIQGVQNWTVGGGYFGLTKREMPHQNTFSFDKPIVKHMEQHSEVQLIMDAVLRLKQIRVEEAKKRGAWSGGISDSASGVAAGVEGSGGTGATVSATVSDNGMTDSSNTSPNDNSPEEKTSASSFASARQTRPGLKKSWKLSSEKDLETLVRSRVGPIEESLDQILKKIEYALAKKCHCCYIEGRENLVKDNSGFTSDNSATPESDSSSPSPPPSPPATKEEEESREAKWHKHLAALPTAALALEPALEAVLVDESTGAIISNWMNGEGSSLGSGNAGSRPGPVHVHGQVYHDVKKSSGGVDNS